MKQPYPGRYPTRTAHSSALTTMVSCDPICRLLLPNVSLPFACMHKVELDSQTSIMMPADQPSADFKHLYAYTNSTFFIALKILPHLMIM